jgi:hypothetical protein
MKQIKKPVNLTNGYSVDDAKKFLMLFALIILIVSSLRPQDSTALISIFIALASLVFYIYPLSHSAASAKIKHIETRLEKFYIPLYNLLINQNVITTTEYQEKMNEINCYIYLAESCVRYRFRTYQKTNWFRDELLEQIKKDIEIYQKEYRSLIEDII